MPHRGPHISISPEYVVNRILKINFEEFSGWPQGVQKLAIDIAEELFLIVYNPFVSAEAVRKSVNEHFKKESQFLSHQFATAIEEGITMFWSAYEAEVAFRKEVAERLASVIPQECILTSKFPLVACSSDTTDLRMELPLLVVEPNVPEEISAVIKLANEMKFAVVPRGGGSGYTGGAIPAHKRSVVICTARLTGKSLDAAAGTMTCQAGVITQDAIDFAASKGFLFTVDPASKTAATIGGNVSENSGGPFCFEYGTTIDNLLSWTMVTPTGEIIRIERVNYPGHKILPEETAVFEVKDISGGLRKTVSLKGSQIRKNGLGKDVTNKLLGGLPGMQKEGIDGIITEATFKIHDKPRYSRVMSLEFYGNSMVPAAELVQKVVTLRDNIRKTGGDVRVAALEEFNSKYVKAINYQKKSPSHESSPISVIIVQVDGNDGDLLDSVVKNISELAGKDNPYVYPYIAKDDKDAAAIWEDRHRLSAICKDTSGYKLNEDVVLPLEKIPEFAHYLECVNVITAASAYRYALQTLSSSYGFPINDESFNEEFTFASQLAGKTENEIDGEWTDDAIEKRAQTWLTEQKKRFSRLAGKIDEILTYMKKSRVIVASHMHAGDGNCHVNIPLNSNDLKMVEYGEEIAMQAMAKAQELGGAVSGEHGIGITKIAFLDKKDVDELREFKMKADPSDLLNPGKLVTKTLSVQPFTFSFNRLIEDIQDSGMRDKESLIRLLQDVQICTRCGKCKQVCPMTYPESSYQYHPRNKNLILGAIAEAIYYSQVTDGKPGEEQLEDLRSLMEHCTGCGRCTSVCPVKIESPAVALTSLNYVRQEGVKGHPLKGKVLKVLSASPSGRIPPFAKMAAVGQNVMNRVIPIVPKTWRNKIENPLFSGKGPGLGFVSIYDSLHLDTKAKAHIFVPAGMKLEEKTPTQAVFYFPGCGGALFYRRISIATIALLLEADIPVVIPGAHLCCGYPLLPSGEEKLYEENLTRNRQAVTAALQYAAEAGFEINMLVTACGSCRESLSKHGLAGLNGNVLEHRDIVQLLSEKLPNNSELSHDKIIYHASCHPAWSGIKATKDAGKMSRALERLTGASILLNAGCCGESGAGAYTSPQIYNTLRERKKLLLQTALKGYAAESPILVGCPSCKIGIARSLMLMDAAHPARGKGQFEEMDQEAESKTNMIDTHRPVLHSAEWLAMCQFGKKWLSAFKNNLIHSDEKGVRIYTLKEKLAKK